MRVRIDPDAGFCFGVARAIKIVEEELGKSEKLLSIGDIVHNSAEVERLKDRGLEVISHADLKSLKGKTVLIRAHGEPPSTYEQAEDSGVNLIDATCPIVLKLQQKIRKAWEEERHKDVQLVIFGKHKHPEVLGLQGQVDNHAIVVSGIEDLENVDFNKPVRLFCQTTMSNELYEQMTTHMRLKMKESGNEDLQVYRSVCRQVSGRAKSLREFAASNEVVIFASDLKSSNGKYLFSICQSVNPRSYFVHDISGIDKTWFKEVKTVGITGATSTPQWLMEKIAGCIENLGNTGD